MWKHWKLGVSLIVIAVLIAGDDAARFRRRIRGDHYTQDVLPKLYRMDHYIECLRKNGTLCIVDFSIRSNDPNSELTKEIQKSKMNQLRFDRSKIYRMMCLLSNQTTDEQGTLKKTVNEELKNFELETEIKQARCEKKLPFIKYDILYAALFIAYAGLVLKATKYDLLDRRKKNHVKSKYEKLYNIFSIKKNWEKILKDNPNTDYQKLKFVQGIRFYAMVMVVMCHTKLSFGSLYVENPMAIENMLQQFFFTLQFDLFIIQTFFMISCFLLTNQIFEVYKKNGEFTLYDCWVLYINRIVRLFPIVLLIVLLVQLLTKTMPIGPQVWDLFFMVFHNCQTNWWMTLFQLNFLLIFNQMCMPGSWYLGVDTMLYVTTIVLLYVTLKFRLDLKKVLTVAFVAMTVRFAYVIYQHDHDVMFISDADVFRDLYHSDAFENLYISYWSSHSTCCVGIAMGAIYFHLKNTDLKLGKICNFLWYLTFLGVPFILVYVATREYDSLLVRMILGPLLKPAYAVVMGIGVLGMTQNLGGTVRKILEWHIAVKLSNFTFCVYLSHFLMVFSKGVFSYELVEFQLYQVWIYFVIDVVFSFILGGICTLTVELPWSEVQKLYLPKVGKSSKPRTPELRVEHVTNGDHKVKNH